MKPEDIKETEDKEQTSAAQEDNTNNESQESVDATTEETAEENTEGKEKSSEAADTSAENSDKDPLDIALAEISELKTKMLYMQAEFDNYRKRVMKEKADLILSGGEKTITAVLPVIDDFERALADKSDNPEAIREGMQLIYQKFIKTLEGLGVKKIETDGADFNVDYHEAIAQVPGMGEDKAGKVIDCVQTGYTLNDKVIRFAKVAVGV